MALGKLYFRICDGCREGVRHLASTTAQANRNAKRAGWRKAVYHIDRWGQKSYSDRCGNCPDPVVTDSRAEVNDAPDGNTKA